MSQDMGVPASPSSHSDEPASSLAANAGSVPNAEQRIATALRVMQICNSFDGPDCDSVWWRTDGEYAPVTMLVNCNDLFFWACADCEIVTPESVEALAQAVGDIAAIDDCEVDKAGLLWVCRVRGMRPQGAYYKYISEKLWPLFDACGPVREAKFGNPASHPAQVDTDPKGEDAKQASCASSGSAVPATSGDAPRRSGEPSGEPSNTPQDTTND